MTTAEFLEIVGVLWSGLIGFWNIALWSVGSFTFHVSDVFYLSMFFYFYELVRDALGGEPKGGV